MRIINLMILVYAGVALSGCAQLAKTGEFVWNAPGKVASGVGKTGKFLWNAPGKIASGAVKTAAFTADIIPKSGPELQEAVKFVWGSSTKALEDAKVDAIKKKHIIVASMIAMTRS